MLKIILTSMQKKIQARKEINKVEYSRGKAETNQNLQWIIDTPYDLNDI